MLSKDHALMNIEQQSPKPSAGWNKHPTIPGHLMYFRSASKWVFKKKMFQWVSAKETKHFRIFPLLVLVSLHLLTTSQLKINKVKHVSLERERRGSGCGHQTG